ncbi:MAG TPA: hypothetical protein PK867_01845 [Pirellulales bacterium]|nr:hypothetical protein [Pirellulales bacterium]
MLVHINHYSANICKTSNQLLMLSMFIPSIHRTSRGRWLRIDIRRIVAWFLARREKERPGREAGGRSMNGIGLPHGVATVLQRHAATGHAHDPIMPNRFAIGNARLQQDEHRWIGAACGEAEDGAVGILSARLAVFEDRRGEETHLFSRVEADVAPLDGQQLFADGREAIGPSGAAHRRSFDLLESDGPAAIRPDPHGRVDDASRLIVEAEDGRVEQLRPAIAFLITHAGRSSALSHLFEQLHLPLLSLFI